MKEKEKEVDQLKYIIKEISWMAQRYAHLRRSYSVSMFNDAIHLLDSMGLSELHKVDSNGKRFADDGSFGVYDPITKRHFKE
jgi:hypothetical protein